MELQWVSERVGSMWGVVTLCTQVTCENRKCLDKSRPVFTRFARGFSQYSSKEGQIPH